MPETGTDLATLPYRADLDGLRAFAVILVVGYHAGVPGLNAGFIGVDIFFVISGYLITSLLLRELDTHGRINLLEFYARRVRRLMPAMLLVISATLLLGYLLLPPIGPLQHLSMSAIASLGFVANYYFISTTGGYFDDPTEQVPLLHMWSLAVEEQFYAIWPLILIGAVYLAARSRFPHRGLVLGAALAIGILSFLYNLHQVPADSHSAYFSVLTRSWQLMAGALLAVGIGRFAALASPHTVRALACIGLLALGASLALIDGTHHYPGALALLPTVAAGALVILGEVSRHHWLSRQLSRGWLVYVGRISYPWYLWHWPLLAIHRDYTVGEQTLSAALAIAAVSFVLAHLTHRYVERPFSIRIRKRRTPSLRLIRTAAVSGLLITLGALTINGYAEHEKETGFYRQLAIAEEDKPRLREDCHLPPPFEGLPELSRCTHRAAPPDILLWGDSHADHYSPALESFSRRTGVDFTHRSFSACRPLLGFRESRYTEARNEECAAFNVAVIEEIIELKEQGLQGVALGAAWLEIPEEDQEAALRALQITVAALTAHELRVLIFLPTPIYRLSVVKCLARRKLADCSALEDGSFARLRQLSARLQEAYGDDPRVRTIDINRRTCRRENCEPMLRSIILFRDKHHLTARGARRLAPLLHDDLAWLGGHAPGANADAKHSGHRLCASPWRAARFGGACRVRR